jgi:hypothetical protein
MVRTFARRSSVPRIDRQAGKKKTRPPLSLPEMPFFDEPTSVSPI